MIESSIFLIAMIGAAMLVIIVCFLFKNRKKYPYFSREILLTPAELKFYKILRQVVLENQAISCKVRLADIINCSEVNWHKGYGPKISSKHIDFVLFDSETTEILLCIELDDSSHQLPHRKKRDVFIDKSLNAANLPILRIKTARGYDMAFLQKEIKIALK